MMNPALTCACETSMKTSLKAAGEMGVPLAHQDLNCGYGELAQGELVK